MSTKLLLLTGALCQALAGAAWATDPSYINGGTVTVPPNIDAITFTNNGTFSVGTLPPFKTQNTQIFANNFRMFGIGYDFALYQGNFRKPAALFFNQAPQPNGAGGLVTVTDGGIGLPSQLLIWATNVNNQGFLTAGGAGLIRVVGTNVTLPLSTLAVNPVAGNGVAEEDTNSFASDVGIHDYYWGVGYTNGNQVNVGNGRSPTHVVTNYPGSASGGVTVGVNSGSVWANTQVINTAAITITNADGSQGTLLIESNMYVEVAFVGPSTPVFTPSVTVTPSTIPFNYYNAFNVILTSVVTNPVARANDLLTIGIRDQTGSRPNIAVAANTTTNPPSYRPRTLAVTRTGTAGTPPNDDYDIQLFTGGPTDYGFTTFTNTGMTNVFASYDARVDNWASEPVSPTLSAANFPGRVEITAGSLNMDRTRIRSEGLMALTAQHMISMSNAVLDCQNFNLNLGSTNGSFRLLNIFPVTVERLHGDVFVYSGIWTNSRMNVITNNFAPDPAGSTNAMGMTNYVSSPITNFTQVGFHVLIVDAELVLTTPVTTENLALHATNVVSDASNVVSAGFFTDAKSFTLNGSLSFGQFSVVGLPAIQQFVATNTPNLLYFTNNGVMSVPNDAHFGDDRPVPYATIINNGTLTAGSFSFRSDYFENPGIINSFGNMSLTAQSSKLDGGTLSITAGLQIQGGDAKLRNFKINVGTLNLGLTNSLSDNGASSGNQIFVGTGFNLIQKPTTGDLLGTQITSAATFGIISHVWAGEDRGASRAGFSNNVAIGYLKLTNVFGLLTFQGAGAHNGLYVDYLDLGASLTNLQDLLSVDPSLTIYFAAANLPAEQLDGQLGGRLRWVRDYAGANSSASVLLPNGQTIIVNKAYRQSTSIDSDADGLPNGVDPSPFDGVSFTRVTVTNQPPPRSVQIAWEAAAGTAYRVEFATNLVAPVWQFLANYTNSAATNGPATVVDAGVPTSQSQRYYRVVYTP